MSRRVNSLSQMPRTLSTETPALDPDAPAKPLRRVSDGFESTASPTVKRRSSAYTLTNEGGAVLSKPVVNNIYLGDYWTTSAGKADMAHNDAFAKDVLKSNYMNVLAQYGVNKGSFAGSTVVGGNPTEINEADVKSIVQKAIASGTQSSDPQAVHTVILPPGCVLTDGQDTSQNGLGGYHGSYTGADGQPVYFAVISYGQGQNGIDFDGNPQDAVSIVESHEWSEAFTDPDVESTSNSRGVAWYNDQHGEIGDEAIDALSLSKVYGKVDGYAVQKEWSNQDGAFEVTPKSSKTTTPSKPIARGKKGKTTVYG